MAKKKKKKTSKGAAARGRAIKAYAKKIKRKLVIISRIAREGT